MDNRQWLTTHTEQPGVSCTSRVVRKEVWGLSMITSSHTGSEPSFPSWHHSFCNHGREPTLEMVRRDVPGTTGARLDHRGFPRSIRGLGLGSTTDCHRCRLVLLSDNNNKAETLDSIFFILACGFHLLVFHFGRRCRHHISPSLSYAKDSSYG